ncbi:MAG: HupE/UreJ family protein [Gammaproteobacteria bacterium]|nr:HupE/UreJ family protein [Gammaproteobacteria bacterium]
MSILKRPSQWLMLAAMVLFTGLAYAHGMSEAEKQSIVDGGMLEYLWLGATHMLSGYDHLLFVFGIIFFLTNLRDIIKYISVFTLGHSVTLIFATFIGIQLNYFIIDAIIGLSVAYIGFANLDGFKKHFQIQPPNLLMMILLLGLIHGFGLSTRLQQLPLDQDNLLLSIIVFNLGIELGQILALSIMLFLLAGWRKLPSFQPFSLMSNYGLMFAGVLLFLMQMHGYSHVSNPDEFGFSSDNHYHEHLKMDAPTDVNGSRHNSIDK